MVSKFHGKLLAYCTLRLWPCLSEINVNTTTKLRLVCSHRLSLRGCHPFTFPGCISLHPTPKGAYSSFHLHHTTTPPLYGNFLFIIYISICTENSSSKMVFRTPPPPKYKPKKLGQLTLLHNSRAPCP